MRPTR